MKRLLLAMFFSLVNETCINFNLTLKIDLHVIIQTEDLKRINYFLVRTNYRAIDLMIRVFANGPGDQGWSPGQVKPKTQKMVLDATLLNTRHYKVRIKSKVDQSREWSIAHLSVVAIKKECSGHPQLRTPLYIL